ncbi:MAG TPA: hypothetical protein PLE45_05665 [Spirochaetota bacterium]|nr:hypothetical protein [Spirochaetota bacterium]HPP04342.1 hypothetical protein [Spirochaetota bacterium]
MLVYIRFIDKNSQSLKMIKIILLIILPAGMLEISPAKILE